MNPRLLKIFMLNAHITQAGISKELNVSRSFVNQVVSNRRSTRRIRDAIARAIGMPTEFFWPQKEQLKQPKRLTGNPSSESDLNITKKRKFHNP